MCDFQRATHMIEEVSILVIGQIVPLYFKSLSKLFLGDRDFNHSF